jgi:ribosomal-protein-alanine N-acetyltransferase
VSDQLRDGFPFPYTVEHAKLFLAGNSPGPVSNLAIEIDGLAVGSIGCRPGQDIERVSGEIGYWLGVDYWGRGIMTEAVTAATKLFFEQLDLQRIFAVPFATNEASCRVLEKSGYRLEGLLPQSAIKDGQVRDQAQYGAYRA